MRLGRAMGYLCGLVMVAGGLSAQSTQSTISGRVYDYESDQAVGKATVRYRNLRTGEDGTTNPDKVTGWFHIPGIMPGSYQMRVEGDGRYQPQEINDLAIPVAARITLDFALVPRKQIPETLGSGAFLVSGTQAIAHRFGPDAESGRIALVREAPPQAGTLLATLSYVIEPKDIQNLPLSGRNAYNLLLFQPGVTSSGSSNGNRPESGLFLIDGADSSVLIAPEAIQEYRVSTNNFSAEYGRVPSFVSNAATWSGTPEYRGMGWVYGNHHWLNANPFQSNAQGFPRQRRSEMRSGLRLGGPVRVLPGYFSGVYEFYRAQSRDYPHDYKVPILESFEKCAANSNATALLKRLRPPQPTGAAGEPGCKELTGTLTMEYPILLRRSQWLARYDLPLRDGKDRVMVRYNGHREISPYAYYNGYEDATSEGTGWFQTGAVQYQRTGTNWVQLTRVAHQQSRGTLLSRQPELPWVDVQNVLDLLLPRMPPDQSYDRRSRYSEVRHDFSWARQRHHLNAGGAWGEYAWESSLPTYGAGRYLFATLEDFAKDRPSSYLALERRTTSLREVAPEYPDRRRRQKRRQGSFFLQDNLKLSKGWTVGAGIRYEFIGPIRETIGKDPLVIPGAGQTPEEQLRGANLWFPTSCCQDAFGPDWNNVGLRVNTAYQFSRTGTVVRAAFGTFHDSPGPLDTWRNSFSAVTVEPKVGYLPAPDYTRETLLLGGPGFNTVIDRDRKNRFLNYNDANLQAPMVQNWFAGIQQQIGSKTVAEVSHIGSLGRRLLTTDRVNRTDVDLDEDSRLNPGLPDLDFRSNAGRSSYAGLAGMLRYNGRRTQVRAAYTWGHVIDNQSSSDGRFTRQFDTKLDRGSADFDQRQNLVFYWLTELPSPQHGPWLMSILRDWRLAQAGGLRSGFPYTILADNVLNVCPTGVPVPAGEPRILFNRPNLIGPARLEPPQPDTGSVRLLRPEAFCQTDGRPGTLGRNAFTGPGFWNVDMSLAKSIRLAKAGDAGRLELRADFFNVFNHANLGQPTIVSAEKFVQAFYGGSRTPQGGASTVPLDAIPRRIELQLRLLF